MKTVIGKMAEGVLYEMAKDLLESIGKPAFQKVSTWRSARADLRKLERTLRMIKARVIDAEKRSKEENTELIKEWLRRLRVVFYKADDLFDDVFIAEQRKRRTQGNMVKKVHFLFSSSSPLLFNIQVAREIKAIREELDAIESDMNGLNLRECDHSGDSHFSMSHLMNKRETASFVQKGDIIGRDDDVDEIINKMFDPKFAEEVVSVIPIVGFGGIGKTTLAQLVFNDERVKNQFELSKWACVPEINNPNEVMRTICNSFTDMNCRDMSLEQLQSRIRESISNKKYLLVLDDIWDESRDRWLQLMSLLKCGAKGSKVIVTTRSSVVADIVGTVPSYKLGLLKEEQSWELFKRLALKEGQEEGNPNFTRIGKDIVDRCANVPLAIRVIGSLLYSKDTEHEWLLVKTGMTEDGNIMPVLKLSYDFLSSPLKQCFAYCSVFKKDHYFEKNELVRLWIAQGYIKASKESLDLEEIGDLHFLELIRRNFFQDVQVQEDDYTDYVSCKMHDLLHDLALHVTSEEDIGEEDTPSFLATNKMRSSILKSYDSRSILTVVIPNFETLRALEFYWHEKTLPDCIWKLRHLRYLKIWGCENIECLPDAITKLENLQTLNLYSCYRLKQLPRGFTRLSNLRHLGLLGSKLIDFPPGFEKMRCLRELTTFVVGKCNGVDALANLDLRGKLEIRFGRWRRNTMLEAGRVNLKGKQQLMDLTLDLSFQEEDVTPSTSDVELLLECLMFPPSLKNLKVIGYSGEMFPRRMVEDLPNLLPKLVRVSISHCKSIRQIPRLSSLQYLKFLELFALEELEYIEEDGWGDNGEPCSSTVFPALTELRLIDLPKPQGWWSSPGVKSRRLPVIFSPCLSTVFIRLCQQTLVELFMSHHGEASSSPASSSIHLFKLKHLEIREIYNLFSFPINFCTSESLTIRNCDKLTSLTAISPNSSIRVLCIEWCPRLKKVHDGLQHLLALEELVIFSCDELEIWDIKTWPHLRSLRSLEINSVSKLEVLPSSIGCLTTLQRLQVQSLHNLIALPEEITQLPQLRELEISDCKKLTSLPQSFCNLSSLQQLQISFCPKLTSLPQSFCNLSSLQQLQISCCEKLTSLPQSFCNLSSLQQLGIYSCERLTSLPQSFCNLSSLQQLLIVRCTHLETRCHPPNGEYWPLIKHIPKIRIGSESYGLKPQCT